jgi:lysylphosphatidylglycerol synthetase-like protein (DUF2156 family)
VLEQENVAAPLNEGRGAGASAISVCLKLLGAGPVLILVILVAVISITTPVFLKPANISNILAQTSVIAIVALGQHLVILTRGIDLSVGANLALATVIGGLLFKVTDSAIVTIAAMLVTGVLVGFVTAGSTSSGGCRTRSSLRLRRSASAAASRTRFPRTTRRCAGCRTRLSRSAAAIPSASPIRSLWLSSAPAWYC